MVFIDSIQIENFRGIKKGEIEGLVSVNILLGPNGAGKSTILEALYLASAWAKREDSIRGLNKEDYVILRRTGRGNWSTAQDILWYNMDTEKEIRISILSSMGQFLDFRIPYKSSLFRGDQSPIFIKFPTEFLDKSSPSWLSRAYISSSFHLYDPLEASYKGLFTGPIRERFHLSYSNIIDLLKGTIFIDSMFLRNPKFLEERLWSKLLAKRLDRDITKIIREGYEPSVEDLTYAPLYKDEYVLFLKLHDTSISIDGLGDGARNAIGLMAPLVLARETVVLMEDPEIHQHPGGMAVLMRAILEIAKKKLLQLIISTQSIEFVKITLKLCERLGISAKVFFIERENGELNTRVLKELDVDTLMKLGIDPRFLRAF